MIALNCNKDKLILIGGGGHATVVRDMAKLCGYEVEGYVAHCESAFLREMLYLGDDEYFLNNNSPACSTLINAVGSVCVADNKKRSDLFISYKRRGFSFTTLTHPSAIIAAEITLGEGVQVMAGAILQPGCAIGDNVIINTGAVVEHHCIVAGHAHLAPRATLCGGCKVGAGSFIGAGAVCVQGMELPEAIMVKANVCYSSGIKVQR